MDVGKIAACRQTVILWIDFDLSGFLDLVLKVSEACFRCLEFLIAGERRVIRRGAVVWLPYRQDHARCIFACWRSGSFDQGFKSPSVLLSFLSERGHDFLVASLVLFVALLAVLVHSVDAVPEHEYLPDADGSGDGSIEVEFSTILENLGYGIEYHVHHLLLAAAAA